MAEAALASGRELRLDATAAVAVGTWTLAAVRVEGGMQQQADASHATAVGNPAGYPWSLGCTTVAEGRLWVALVEEYTAVVTDCTD